MNLKIFSLVTLSMALNGFAALEEPSSYPMRQAELLTFEAHDLVVTDFKTRLIMYGVPNQGYRMKPTSFLMLEESKTDSPSQKETEYQVSSVTRLSSGGLKIEANEIFTQNEDERMPRRLEIIDHSVSPENSARYGWMISLIDTDRTTHFAGNPIAVR
jgi:hypothetical protein